MPLLTNKTQNLEAFELKTGHKSSILKDNHVYYNCSNCVINQIIYKKNHFKFCLLI